LNEYAPPRVYPGTELALAGDIRLAEDRLEGLAGFREKRKPVNKGK
jgi:hypothetical protein